MRRDLLPPWRHTCALCVVMLAICTFSGPLSLTAASAATRLKPQSAPKNVDVTRPERAAPSVNSSLDQTRASVDPYARVAELTARLSELEGPAKAENPGMAIDDASVPVNPIAQPILAEYRDVQKELDSLNATFDLSGHVPATPVLQNEVESNNTAGTANALVFGVQSAATVAGTIGVAGDADYFSFTAAAGARVWIDVDTGSPPAQVGSSRDSIVDLFDTNGTSLIETDDDDGTGSGGDGTTETGLASVISNRVLPSAGTYFIRVTAFSGTINPYRLYVHVNGSSPVPEVESNDSAGTANPGIVPPAVVAFRSGTLTPGDNDFFSINLQTGDRVLIALDGDPGRDGTSTNVRFQLRDTDGTSPIILANSGSTSGGFNAEGLVFDIPVSGTYFVRVFGGAGSTTGDYTLLIDDTDGNNTQPCVITCPANQMATENPPGSGGAVVNYPAPTSTGSCAPIICSPASGSTFPVGTTTVTCFEQIIGSPQGGASCNFTVTVTLACAAIQCPANVTVSNTNGQCGAVVNYSPPTGTGCGTITCSPASGSSFPIGTTTVTCTSAAGPSCSFTVTVNDTQPPSITCPANIVTAGTTVSGCTLSAVVNYATPAANDNCPGATVSCVPASGSTFPEGTTTVTCTTTDASGNTASCSFSVTVGGAGVFGVCVIDDFSGDTWSIVTDPASPLYRFWRYRIAATGEIICGTANFLSYIPGQSLIAYDNDDPRFFMDANINFGSHTAVVKVVDRSPRRSFVLRDRNTLNDPPCF